MQLKILLDNEYNQQNCRIHGFEKIWRPDIEIYLNV